jgi:hypothetical protein
MRLASAAEYIRWLSRYNVGKCFDVRLSQWFVSEVCPVAVYDVLSAVVTAAIISMLHK